MKNYGIDVLLSKLKQSNISKDAEKTKSRVKSLWKATDKPTREVVLDLAGVKIVTLQRTYLNGNISARMALALAKTLNVNPYYLIGQIDEVGTFSDTVMTDLLRELKYDKLLAEAGLGEPKKRGRRKAAPVEAPAPVAEAAPAAEAVAEEVVPPAPIEPAPAEIIPVAVDTAPAAPVAIIPDIDVDLTEDEAILLLKAAFLKAKAGGVQAEKAKQLKAMLLN